MSEADGRLGLPLDDDLAQGIPLVGFDDGDATFAEPTFFGFDDEPASAEAAADTPATAIPAPDRLGALRQTAGLPWLIAREIATRLRYFLIGTTARARRTRTAVLIVGAVLLSVGCGVVLRNMLPARRAQQILIEAAPIALPPSETSVLVARQEIARGHLITATDIAWQPWPAARIKESYIPLGTRDTAGFVGDVAREPIASGEPIDRSMLIAPGDRGFLSAILRPGMRAMSIAISPETAVSGLIKPGDEIDVVLTVPVLVADRRNPNDTDSRYGVETVLSDMRVLAIDQELDSKSDRAILGSTATVETTPKQAEILALSGYLASYYNSKLLLTLKSLTRDDPDKTRPSAPKDGDAHSSMVDADISKLLSRRDTVAAEHPATGLTIIRRSTVSDTHGP